MGKTDGLFKNASRRAAMIMVGLLALSALQPAEAGSESGENAPKIKITLLGTGTPTPSLKRAGSGYLIEIGNDVILWDHGPGAFQRLLEAGKKVTQVTHIFFSHLHSDHCLDFVRLFLTRWDQGADLIPELKIFGPPGTRRMTELLFNENGAFSPDINARIKHQGSINVFVARGGKPPRKWPKPEITEFKLGDRIEGQGWTITVGPASHVQPYLECFSFRLDSAAGSVCYSGDSGGVLPGLVELARGCDVLIHMNYYYTGTEPSQAFQKGVGSHEDVARIAREAGVKTLVLTHFLEQIDQPGIREQIIREIAKIYPGYIIWGEDLMEIPISGPALTKIR